MSQGEAHRQEIHACPYACVCVSEIELREGGRGLREEGGGRRGREKGGEKGGGVWMSVRCVGDIYTHV